MDFISYTKYFAALAVIIIILLVIAYIFKKFTQNKPRISAQSEDIFNSKSASLFVQEVLPIDQKNKIIIIGRDNLRHVILLGENHSNLIETVTPEQRPASQSNFTASNQVGSITTTATTASPMANVQSPEPQPDLSNIEPEASTDEPKLTTNIKDVEISENIEANEIIETIEISEDAEIAEAITQAKDDMSPQEGKATDTDKKALKDKLQDAKDLAKPNK